MSNDVEQTSISYLRNNWYGFFILDKMFAFGGNSMWIVLTTQQILGSLFLLRLLLRHPKFRMTTWEEDSNWWHGATFVGGKNSYKLHPPKSCTKKYHNVPFIIMCFHRKYNYGCLSYNNWAWIWPLKCGHYYKQPYFFPHMVLLFPHMETTLQRSF